MHNACVCIGGGPVLQQSIDFQIYVEPPETGRAAASVVEAVADVGGGIRAKSNVNFAKPVISNIVNTEEREGETTAAPSP